MSTLPLLLELVTVLDYS